MFFCISFSKSSAKVRFSDEFKQCGCFFVLQLFVVSIGVNVLKTCGSLFFYDYICNPLTEKDYARKKKYKTY